MLNRSERHYLELLRPEGSTINKGLTVGEGLRRRGLVHMVRYGRYGITEKGRQELDGCPNVASQGQNVAQTGSNVASPSAAAPRLQRAIPAAKKAKKAKKAKRPAKVSTKVRDQQPAKKFRDRAMKSDPRNPAFVDDD